LPAFFVAGFLCKLVDSWLSVTVWARVLLSSLQIFDNMRIAGPGGGTGTAAVGRGASDDGAASSSVGSGAVDPAATAAGSGGGGGYCC